MPLVDPVPVCLACLGAGLNSKGGACYPCSVREYREQEYCPQPTVPVVPRTKKMRPTLIELTPPSITRIEF